MVLPHTPQFPTIPTGQFRVPVYGAGAREGACSAPIQTNVYLTPAGAQGFPAHWDTHDVFVLQVFGRKQWTIYDTKIDLSLRGQSFDHELHHAGAATAEFELAAGDCAYIPRGLIHSAKSSDAPSLHVTVGVLGMTWAELLLETISAAAVEDRSLREYLPLGFARSDHASETFAVRYADRIAAAIAYLKDCPRLDTMQDALARERASVVDGVLQGVLSISRRSGPRR